MPPMGGVGVFPGAPPASVSSDTETPRLIAPVSIPAPVSSSLPSFRIRIMLSTIAPICSSVGVSPLASRSLLTMSANSARCFLV